MSETLLMSTTSNPDHPEEEIDPESAESAAEASLKTADDNDTAEHVRVLLEDCKKLLVPDVDNVVGSWGLIDNDPVSGTRRK